MPDRSLKLRELQKILRRFGVSVAKDRGKGSHILLQRKLPEGVFTYPVPDERDVLVCYVRAIRRRFRLTPADGVSDNDFYEG